MRIATGLALFLLLSLASKEVEGHPIRSRFLLWRTNLHLYGQVLDFTHNHGADRRIYSPALKERRDLYVYLPPGYDPCKRYPLIVFLHGYAQDECALLRDVIKRLDKAIHAGKFPPSIVVSPDGSLNGLDCLFGPGSFFLNSKAGAYEDFLMVDVWNFVVTNFRIRPEPEAHAFLGVSMGGGAAFNKLFKYPDRFRVAVGIYPPVNLRWVDCKGNLFGNFDPHCWGWRTVYRPRDVLGRFYQVLIVRTRKLIDPLFGRNNPNLISLISQENPIEMLDHYDVRPGQFQMYIAYGGLDEFNIDAQVESFLYRARQRGLDIAVNYEPWGRHNRRTAYRMVPEIIDWLSVRLTPYAPHR